MRLPEVVKRILGVLAVILSLLLCWSGAYWFTSWFFTVIHYLPQEYARLLINSTLGFFLFGCCIFLITNNKWARKRENKILHPMIHAMKIMAEGNFNIDLLIITINFKDMAMTILIGGLLRALTIWQINLGKWRKCGKNLFRMSRMKSSLP